MWYSLVVLPNAIPLVVFPSGIPQWHSPCGIPHVVFPSGIPYVVFLMWYSLAVFPSGIPQPHVVFVMWYSPVIFPSGNPNYIEIWLLSHLFYSMHIWFYSMHKTINSGTRRTSSSPNPPVNVSCQIVNIQNSLMPIYAAQKIQSLYFFTSHLIFIQLFIHSFIHYRYTFAYLL